MNETDVRIAGDDNDALPSDEGAVSGDGDAQAAGASDETAAGEKSGRLLPLVAGIVAVLTVGAVVAILLLTAETVREATDKPVGSLADQANWQITTYSIGGKHPKLKKPPPPKAESRALGTLVREVHDGLFLFPGNFKQTAAKHFAAPAAKEITSRRRFGVTAQATDVKTLHRSARIAVDASGRGRATARVLVVVTGRSRGSGFRSLYEGKLWIERQNKGWTVIAYEVEERPVSAQWRKSLRAEVRDPSDGPRKTGSDKQKKTTKGGKA